MDNRFPGLAPPGLAKTCRVKMKLCRRPGLSRLAQVYVAGTGYQRVLRVVVWIAGSNLSFAINEELCEAQMPLLPSDNAHCMIPLLNGVHRQLSLRPPLMVTISCG